MNVPRRILDGGLGKWERHVVQSGTEDAPSAESRRRMARQAARLAAMTAASGAVPVAAHTLGAFASLKLFGIGALVGLATAGIFHAASDVVDASRSKRGRPTTEVDVAPPVPRSTPPTAMGARPPSVEGPAARPERLAVEARSVRRVPAAAPSASGPAPIATQTVDSRLAEELRAIESARGELSNGDARGALRELDRYESTSHAGLLHVEAEVLRIEALVRLGDLAQARTLQREFLSQHPGSPYVQRVGALVGDAPRVGP